MAAFARARSKSVNNAGSGTSEMNKQLPTPTVNTSPKLAKP